MPYYLVHYAGQTTHYHGPPGGALSYETHHSFSGDHIVQATDSVLAQKLVLAAYPHARVFEPVELKVD